MATYLLTCECGKNVPVELGQAGGQVSCSCGKRLEVPTLRQLRQLPQAVAQQAKGGGSWDARQGWITASLVMAAILTASALWVWRNQPARPVFVSSDYMASVDHALESWTPTDAWKRWIDFYRPLAERGLPMFQAANAADIEYRIQRARFMRGMLLSVAGVFAAIAAAAYFWPAPVAVKR